MSTEKEMKAISHAIQELARELKKVNKNLEVITSDINKKNQIEQNTLIKGS